MILNPSPFFPEYKSTTWIRVQFYERPWMEAACNHAIYASTIFGFRVFMEQKKLVRDASFVRFYVGKCPQCKRVFWACENLEWVAWLTDYEIIQMLARGSGMKITEERNQIRIAEQRLHFYKGKLEESARFW